MTHILGRNMYKIIGLTLAGVMLFAGSVAELSIERHIYIASEKDARCLALNLYHETRSESIDGAVGVAHVVLNRVADKKYPNTICKVVYQGGEKRRHKCQFSWWCDGKNDKPRDKVAWQAMQVITNAVLNGLIEDPTGGSLLYHADYVKPHWASKSEFVVQIGKHLFYRKG